MELIIQIPKEITAKNTITLDKNILSITGVLGTEEITFTNDFNIQVEQIIRIKSIKKAFPKSLKGTFRALLNQAFTGVTLGFRKQLQLVGVGFKANVENNVLVLKIGLSHLVKVPVPSNIEIKCPKPTVITLKGTNLQELTNLAAKIRHLKVPEPYKGKGILHRYEKIKLKSGKKN
jgi:large subunit ribosomal protein L6